MSGTTIGAGTVLKTGDAYISSDGRTVFGLAKDKLFRLTFSAGGDKSVVHFEAADFIEWESGEATQANLYNNGNFSVIDEANKVLWQTWTAGNDGADLAIQDDGNISITKGGKVIWSWGQQKDLKLFFRSARW